MLIAKRQLSKLELNKFRQIYFRLSSLIRTAAHHFGESPVQNHDFAVTGSNGNIWLYRGIFVDPRKDALQDFVDDSQYRSNMIMNALVMNFGDLAQGDIYDYML